MYTSCTEGLDIGEDCRSLVVAVDVLAEYKVDRPEDVFDPIIHRSHAHGHVSLNQVNANFPFEQFLVIVFCVHIGPKLFFRVPKFFFGQPDKGVEDRLHGGRRPLDIRYQSLQQPHDGNLILPQ